MVVLIGRGNFAPLSKKLEASSMEVARMGDSTTSSVTGMETILVGKVSSAECLLPSFFASHQMCTLYFLGSSWVAKEMQVLLQSPYASHQLMQ